MTVELQNLTVRYGTFTAVNGVTVTFPDGAVGLLGRNGAGKSTLLKTVLGFLRGATGSVRVMGVDARVEPLRVRELVGYMPERECYFPLLSGFEMVALAGELSGLPQRQARQRAHECLYYVGLEEQRYRPVSTYSTGMKQKAKLATALVHDPPLLFLDEPTSGLDPKGRAEMLDLVLDLVRNKGRSVILSSHILSDVERCCSSAVLLEQGQVRAAGSLADLTRFTERIYQLKIDGDLAAVQRALGATGFRVTAGEGELLEVAIPEGDPPAVLFRAVQQAGALVRTLLHKRRTLEEVFLAAVQARGPV